MKTKLVRRRINPNDKDLHEKAVFYSKIAIIKFDLIKAKENFEFYDNKDNVCDRIMKAIEWIFEKCSELIKVKDRTKNQNLILSKKYYKMMKEKRKRYAFLKQSNS